VRQDAAVDRAEDWQRLCALLDDDETVWEAVEEALEQGDDPWEALLDGLDDAGALAYLQSDDTGMELTDALAQLPRVYALQPDLDEATDTDDLVEAMRAADGALASGDLRLMRLVEEDDDDSWPVVVVPADLRSEIRSLAEGLGHQATGA
jgi:N-acetylmuramic acid 6-phosphate (MurNAc-6-P) etherase